MTIHLPLLELIHVNSSMSHHQTRLITYNFHANHAQTLALASPAFLVSENLIKRARCAAAARKHNITSRKVRNKLIINCYERATRSRRLMATFALRALAGARARLGCFIFRHRRHRRRRRT